MERGLAPNGVARDHTDVPAARAIVLSRRAPATIDLDRPHEVSPVLVVRLDRRGLGVVPIAQVVEPQQEYDRLTEQYVPEAIGLGAAGLRLLQCLARTRPVIPNEAIEAAARRYGLGEHRRAEVVDLAQRLISGGLLRPLTAAEAPSNARRRLPVIVDLMPREPAWSAVASADRRTAKFAAVAPTTFVPSPEGFELHHYDGSVRAMLSSSSLLVLAAFAEPRSIADVAALLAARADDGDCSEADVRACLERLAGIGLIQSVDPTANAVATTDTRAHALHREADALLLHAIDEEAAAARATGRRRLLVVPVDIEEDSQPLLSFGMLVAYATKHLPAAAHERLRLAPLWYTAPGATSEVLAALREWPTVLLFSCYAWNHARNQRIAAAAKRQLLSCVTVFGGPDVPKYEGDAERYFAMHPQVDIAVRGEGEATFAELLGVLAATDGVNAGDARLESVAGITFRRGDRVVRTPDRERIADLDSIPSPYLTGVYDHVGFPRNIGILLETNRGCPYGCTFCDWGSAILSRVRRFDLERVKQEMTWAAERGRAVFGFADANFGMLGRDVELAEWAVTLKRRYGVPNVFSVNYAKNKVDDLSRIVRTLTEEGILTQGLVSIQSIDPGVLEAVRRSNIKVERYDALATEFRSLGLTLFSDVMVGLPGSTPETLRADFQFGIDREIHVKAHPTQLLVNSPMNEPTYRTTYGITATPGELVTETSTFTRETWNEMMMMRQFFYFAERRGFLRQVATYVRAETGLHEMALYEELRRLARDDGRWPHLAYATSLTPSFVPPGSWAPLIEEVGEILVTALHVGDDDALATVLAVQHALFPFRGRRFPIRVPLQHDYVTWHGRVVAAKSAHGERWPDHVEPLRALGPGTFEVKDEANRCERCIGASVIPVTVLLVDDWELESQIARPNR